MTITKLNGKTQQIENVTIEGHKGTWYLIDATIYNGVQYKLWESENFGEDAAAIITSENGIVLEDVWNGFDDLYEEMEG